MEEIKKRVSFLYGMLFKLNMQLLKKSENKTAQFSCADVFDFYVTSHALSFLKDVYFDLIRSLGFVLNARCILEGIAVKRYCGNSDDSLLPELLKKQKAILEYRCYNDLKEIKEFIVLPETLEGDYKDSVQFYQNSLSTSRGYSEKKVQKIVDSQIPFLCDPYTNYRKLIGEQIGEDYAKLYGLLSQMIHPSLNEVYLSDDLLQSTLFVLELLLSEYSDIPKSEYDLEYYCRISMSSPVPVRLRELSTREFLTVHKIADVIEFVFGNGYISNSLRTFSLIRTEMMIDTILGMREQTKSKWKVLLDLYAVFFEVAIFRKDDSHLIELMRLHDKTQLDRNLKAETNTDEAFSVYRTRYPSGVDRESFDKAFTNMTGYLINENGQSKSLSRLVRDYAKQFEKGTDSKTLYEIYYMNYLESQLLSHANGYMWFANRGAWNDVHSLMNGSSNGLLLLLQALLQNYKYEMSDQNRKDIKPVVNALRNGIKEIVEIIGEEATLMLLPTQKM